MTDEEKRASLSYLVGWTDALMWAVANQTALDQLRLEAITKADTGPAHLLRSVVTQASDVFDEFGADPNVWLTEVPHERMLDIEPNARRCRVCGCTDADCRGCIERTGEPCSWVERLEDDDGPICSACVPAESRL